MSSVGWCTVAAHCQSNSNSAHDNMTLGDLTLGSGLVYEANTSNTSNISCSAYPLCVTTLIYTINGSR